MAFIRRKGNAFYLVHNVRQRGKVKQLHLASLGEQPRITSDVVRHVSRQHPLLELDWRELREQINSRIELFDPRSEFAQKLVRSLRALNLDLADLAPALLKLGGAPEVGDEIITHLRLLRSTLDIKLNQFEQAGRKGLLGERRFR